MKAILFGALALFVIGCSGKIQTNPLPSDKKIHLPNRDLNIEQVDEIEIARKFDLWVMDYLKDSKPKKTIWDIGIQKGDMR